MSVDKENYEFPMNPEPKVSTARERKALPDSLPGDLMFLPFLAIMLAPLCEFIRRYPNINDYADDYLPLVVCFLAFAGVMGIAAICLRWRIQRGSNRKTVRERNVPMLFFGFTLLMMLLSTLVNGITPAVLHGDSYRRESLYSFAAYFIFLFLGATFIQSERKKSILLGAYLFSSLILAVREFIAYMMTPPELAQRYMMIVTSVFEQFNHYGYYLAMAILISSVLIRSREKLLRYLAAVSFLANTAVLVVNDTFGAFLSCLFGLIFSIIVFSVCNRKLDKTAVWMLALFILTALLTNLKCGTLLQNFSQLFTDVEKISSGAEDAEKAGTFRWGIITATIGYISERPLLGFGLEGIGQRLFSDIRTDRPHCEYLQYAAFFGIPAAVSYVLGVFHVFLNGLKHRYELGLYTKAALVAAFGYLVSAAFGNTMYYTAPYLFILLGLGYQTNQSV